MKLLLANLFVVALLPIVAFGELQESRPLFRGSWRALEEQGNMTGGGNSSMPPITCNNIYSFSARPGPGPNSPEGVPGTSGASRWGIPNNNSSLGYPYVRKAWHTLSSEEKERFVLGVALMRNTSLQADLPAAGRAEYATFCSDDFQPSTVHNNLYNYYNELHHSTYKSWGTDSQSYEMRCHQAPHFFPWHRYMILRFEADMRVVLNDTDFTLPYWDWDQCVDDPTCGDLFGEHLGGPGGCDDQGNPENVEDGLLYELGYRVDVISMGDLTTTYNPESMYCIEPRPLQRAYGCDVPVPTSTEVIEAAKQRLIYDVEPYNSCEVDENVSFRQFVEGFKKQEDPNALLEPHVLPKVVGGDGQHGDAHFAVGADLGDQAVPDPIFFLLHANVDRIWAIWQEFNIEQGQYESYGNPGYPEPFMGPLFNFPDIHASEMFDYKALGYTYDTLVEGNLEEEIDVDDPSLMPPPPPALSHKMMDFPFP